MRAYDIIYKKREGKELSAGEIDFLIKGYTTGEIPDYQLSAWAMAVFFQGMSISETTHLTRAMVESGERMDLSPVDGIKVDKHSSGGVGDKTTLVLAPLVSATGVPVAKLSGRGLGHTGGTIDKLESIPGFKTDLKLDKFIKNVKEIGLAVAGQTANLTPADKKLYALRDVTATVDSIPLIASSIMSKKIAGGAEGIVLDVKTGDGAFMKEIDKTRKLAAMMVEIGRELNRKTTAVITGMAQPLGRSVGNALEVKEAIMALKDEGPEDLKELCLTLGANMLVIAEKAKTFREGKEILEGMITSGRALKQFRRFIEAQGGDERVIDNPDLLPGAEYIYEVKAEKSGYIKNIKTRKLGLLAAEMGAGRTKKGDRIDHAVGIVLRDKIGNRIEKGHTLAAVHLNNKKLKDSIIKGLQDCFAVSEEKVKEPKLIIETIS
ncbi:MAG: pyrimidine-nucleoside phosphorylase [Halanaerobiales bacterium]